MDSYYNKLLFNHFDVYFIPTSSIHSLHMSIKIKLHFVFCEQTWSPPYNHTHSA